MQPRKTLSLSKPLSLDTLVKIKLKRSPQQQQNKQVLERKNKIKRIKSALHWLSVQYPDCFNRLAPRPIKLRVEQDIFDDMLRIQHRPAPIEPQADLSAGLPSKKSLRDAVGFYVRNIKYHKSILDHHCRIDLQGHEIPDDLVTDQHRDYARRIIALVQAKKKPGQSISQSETISHPGCEGIHERTPAGAPLHPDKPHHNNLDRVKIAAQHAQLSANPPQFN